MIMKTKLHISLLFSIALSGIAEAALVDGVILQFDPAASGGTTQPTSGAWWGLEFSSATVYTPLASFEGIILGSAQPATGSHSGIPNGTENPTITEPWVSSGSTGMHHSTTPISVINSSGNTATLDFSGFGITWNAIPDISLSGYPANYPSELGIATVTCGVDCSIGDSYVLNYAAHEVPEVGGQLHTIHLEGVIVSSVPIPAAFWLFGSGVILFVGIVRRS